MFALDVETLAIGKTHESKDRFPFLIALLNGQGETLLKSWVKPPSAVVSYLTPLSGVKASDVDLSTSPPLEVVLAELHQHLHPDAILVGQYPWGDIQWCRLEKGVHYRDVIDLSNWFRVWVDVRWVYFSLGHAVKHLLKKNQNQVHDPVQDCQLTLELYHKYKDASEDEKRRVGRYLCNQPKSVNAASLYDFCINGVCLAGFNPKKCVCGRPKLQNFH